MWLKKNKLINWKWIFIGALITAVFVVAGLMGLDKVLYVLIHKPDCNVWTLSAGFWCSFAIILGKIFSVKMWIFGTALCVLAFYIYKAFTNENDFRFAFVKIKNSYVFYVFASVVCALMTTGVLKVLIGRSRPVLFDALGRTYFEPWVFDSIFNSMPSGHSAASFAGLCMIGFLYPRVRYLMWILATVIGISRIYVGAHWPSDIVFGAFIGIVCAIIVKSTLKKINSK